MFKKCGMTVLEWIVRLSNLSFHLGVVPIHGLAWCMYIVPQYKGKGDKYEWSNLRGISLLILVGKLYGRVLIKRVWAGTECVITEEQCEFR